MILRLRSRAFYRELTSLLLVTLLLASPVLGLQSPSISTPSISTKAAPALSAAEREITSRLKVETITDITSALASKEMEGRGTATPGGEKAARYIADRFSKLGIKPLGDGGTYQQSIKFKSQQANSESTIKAGETALNFGDDFVPVTFYASEKTELSGGLVFAGYGIVSQELKRNDLDGLDLKGKIVIVLGGMPKNVNEAAWNKATSLKQLSVNIIARGAAGIIITNISPQNETFSTIATYLTRRRVMLSDSSEPPFKLPPIIISSSKGAEKLFAGSEMTFSQTLEKAEAGEAVSKDLNKTVSLSIRMKKEEVIGSNVIGIIEGSDAKLKEEAVVYTAHFDAFGIGSNGTIYPGAADNALGVGMLISIAEAIAKSPVKPRRSTIFMAVTGEEYGLLGTEFWIKHPTWPIEKIAANINYDGIGTEIYGPVKRITGFGIEHSDLGTILSDVVAATGNSMLPDLMPEEKAFYRSDHYAFVKKGVPAIMLMGCPDGETAELVNRIKRWLETDYHKETDVVRSDWHWEGARTLATIGLIVGLRVGNTYSLPSWLPSSPFNRPRGTNAQLPVKE
jgi:hypothetical protein